MKHANLLALVGILTLGSVRTDRSLHTKTQGRVVTSCFVLVDGEG